ncbi:MAG: AAA family ATPase, partial [Steroidobacteraceae bacterium]
MWPRSYWLGALERLWGIRSVVWLPGVRRAGKTTLCRSLPQVEYFDCELPRQRRLMEDPEGFLASLAGKRVVLDEVHRLRDPSQLLKIAADHFPQVRIIATGSSTLGATR